MPVNTFCLLSLALATIAHGLFVNTAVSRSVTTTLPPAHLAPLFISSATSSSIDHTVNHSVDDPVEKPVTYEQIERQLTTLDREIASYRQQLRETRHSLVKARIMARKHHRTLRHDLTVLNDQISRINAELKYRKDQNAIPLSEQLKELQAQETYAEQELKLAALQLRQLDSEFKQMQIDHRETLDVMLQQRSDLKQALDNHPKSNDRPTLSPKSASSHNRGSNNQHKKNQHTTSVHGKQGVKIVQTIPSQSSRYMLISISDTSLERLEPHLYLQPILNSLSIKHIAVNQSVFLQEADNNRQKAEAQMIKEIVRQIRAHKITKRGLVLLGHGAVGQTPLKVAAALQKKRRINTELLLLINASSPDQQQNQPSEHHAKQQSKSIPLPKAVKSLVNLWYKSDKQDFKRSSNSVLNHSQKNILGYLDLPTRVPSIQQPLFIDQAMRDKGTFTKEIDRPPEELAFLNQVSKELPTLLRGVKEGASIRYTFANLTSSSPELSATEPPYPPSLPSFADEQATLTLQGRAFFSRCHTKIAFKETSTYITFSVPSRDIYHEFFLYNPNALLFNSLGQPLFHDYPSENEYTTAYENGHFSLQLEKNTLSLQLKLGQSLSPKCRFKL